jgi:hypothetical protein
MITKEEAFKLAQETIGQNDRVHLHLTDYEFVCVVEITFEPRQTKETTKPVVEKNDDGDPIPVPVDDSDFVAIPDGMGPILIDKRTSVIYETGSDVLYPADCYADCYLSSGYVRGKPTSTIEISGLADDCAVKDVIELVTAETRVGNASLKIKLKKLQQGRDFEIEATTPDSAISLASSLRALGVKAMQRWIGDGIPQYPDDLVDYDDTTIEIDPDKR